MPSKFCQKPNRARQLHSGLLAILLSVAAALASAQSLTPVRPADGPAFRGDRILVIVKPGHAARLARLHVRNHVRVVREFPEMGGVQILQLPPGADARDFVARYQRSGQVDAAHLDHWIEPAAASDDPYLVNGTQWHLQNLGLVGGLVGADIHATNAWDTLNSASNIIVAVVDSGVRQTHEDLASNLWAGRRHDLHRDRQCVRRSPAAPLSRRHPWTLCPAYRHRYRHRYEPGDPAKDL